MNQISIICGDAKRSLAHLPSDFAQTCITSPPYWNLRDYRAEGQLGLEPTPEEYVTNLVEIFEEVRRVLRPDGSLWLVIGDTYATGGKGGGGSFMEMRKDGAWFNRAGKDKTSGWRGAPPGYKDKDLIGVPWMVAFALRAAGWYFRCDLVWHKSNAMPDDRPDRPGREHEYIFLFSKRPTYFWDRSAIAEPCKSPAETRDRQAEGYNANYNRGARFSPGSRQWGNGKTRAKRSVWKLACGRSKGHHAVFPPALVEPMILSSTRIGDIVIDPFSGTGTTGLVAARYMRHFVGVELNPEYAAQSRARIEQDLLLFNQTRFLHEDELDSSDGADLMSFLDGFRAKPKPRGRRAGQRGQTDRAVGD